VVASNCSRASTLSFAITGRSDGSRCQKSRAVDRAIVRVFEVYRAQLGCGLLDHVGVELTMSFFNWGDLPLCVSHGPEFLFQSAYEELATVQLR
jgi:hypothetical protein